MIFLGALELEHWDLGYGNIFLDIYILKSVIYHKPTSAEQGDHKASNVWGLKGVKIEKMQPLASWKFMPGKLALTE